MVALSLSLSLSLSVVVATAAAAAASSTLVAAAATNAGAAFVATATSRRTRAESSSSGSRHHRARRGAAPPPSPTSLRQGVSGEGDVFLLSFEGTLSATSRYRSWMAVCVALRVWPRLASTVRELGMDPDDFDCEACRSSKHLPCDDEEKPYEWLLRKLSALASVTQQGDTSDAMLGCDAVLLSRLLLEEQLLDRGMSSGRGGKYGGKFHPAATASAREGRGPTVGSRPLTVGELFENWPEIRDMTRGRYPVVEDSSDGTSKTTDPLPKIRQCLAEQYSATRREKLRSDLLPTWQDLTYDILFENRSGSNGDQQKLRQNTMLLLGHAAQLPWALATLSTLCTTEVVSDKEFLGRASTENKATLNSKLEVDGRTVKVVLTTPENARNVMQQQGDVGEKDGGNSNAQTSLLLVVPNSNIEQTQSDMIKQIVQDFDEPSGAKSHSDVFVIHSSVEVLQQCKSFLGDDVPRLVQGQRKCILPQTGKAVTLFLPQWADNVHPTQQNYAEMDPWLNLAGEDQLLELVSGRIVRAPP